MNTEKFTYFIGENAQGKTNVIESIYVLAIAKSHRTTNDKELIRWKFKLKTLQNQKQAFMSNQNNTFQIMWKGAVPIFQKKYFISFSLPVLINNLSTNLSVIYIYHF